MLLWCVNPDALCVSERSPLAMEYFSTYDRRLVSWQTSMQFCKRKWSFLRVVRCRWCSDDRPANNSWSSVCHDSRNPPICISCSILYNRHCQITHSLWFLKVVSSSDITRKHIWFGFHAAFRCIWSYFYAFLDYYNSNGFIWRLIKSPLFLLLSNVVSTHRRKGCAEET